MCCICICIPFHLSQQPQPGDYQYSGIHDHGPLIPPKEGGPMAQLIGCVQAAKQFNDNYLTNIINEEKEKREKKK